MPVVRDESAGDCPLEKALNGEHCYVRSVFVILHCCLGNLCFCQENFKNGRCSAQGSSCNWVKTPARVQNTFRLSDLCKAVCHHLRILSSFLKWAMHCLLLRGRRHKWFCDSVMWTVALGAHCLGAICLRLRNDYRVSCWAPRRLLTLHLVVCFLHPFSVNREKIFKLNYLRYLPHTKYALS